MFGAGKNLNFTNVLNGLSKTLNIANKAIPLYMQAKPMIGNARNAFNIAKTYLAKDLKKTTTSSPKVSKTIQNKKIIHNEMNNPKFFL